MKQMPDNTLMDKLKFEKGTIVHINGVPFELANDTYLYGFRSNLLFANIECIDGKYRSIPISDKFTIESVLNQND